jgi:hypothetical protein
MQLMFIYCHTAFEIYLHKAKIHYVCAAFLTHHLTALLPAFLPRPSFFPSFLLVAYCPITIKKVNISPVLWHTCPSLPS